MALVCPKKQVARPTRRMKKRRVYKPLFIIWVLLVLAHFPGSTTYHRHHHSRVVASQKDIFSDSTKPWFHAAGSASSKLKIGDEEEENFYDEEKRIIPTGPNPLHN
ncbi:hypothetical protein Hanom_Chr16g01434701 [Helianthus anomalus]